jgi:FAD/FMN-containing dehydrogenase
VVITRDRDARISHARDASGLEMIPEAVARAETAADVVDAIMLAAGLGSTVTAAGSQTSMTGASITDRGILLSLAGMNRVRDVDVARGVARVEPGVTIGQLNRDLAPENLIFAPDPTSEQDATIGGAIACNASGARSLYYGATRRHVNAVTVVHADGEIGTYRRSHPEKNTVGYAAAQDPVDWFVGSEGTLGVVIEAELSLVKAPVSPLGLAVPFVSQTAALEFVVAARGGKAERNARCLEFFDEAAMNIAADYLARPWPLEATALIYVEDDAGESGDVEAVLSAWLALSDTLGALTSDIRVFEGAQALRDARAMRHAVPAAMNERGASHMKNGGRKVSTDWAVPYGRLSDALAASDAAVARRGAPAPITYGHAGNGHPHQNFIAENPESLRLINAAVEDTLRCVIEMGGTVSAEHGLGKLKQPWLALQLSERQIAVMRAMKSTLDPSGLFAPGNVL